MPSETSYSTTGPIILTGRGSANKIGVSALLAAATFALCAAAAMAQSQPYPSRPVRLITMTNLISTLQAQRHLLARDFAPVSMVGATPFVIVVNASLPAKSISELIAYAKTRPGQLTYGTGGAWSSSHLCMESLKAIAGIDLLHVPYKGSPLVLNDLIGGRIDACCFAAPAISPSFVQTGKVRLLGVTSLQPTGLAPGVPPVAETIAGFQLLGWYGVQAPLRTPKPLIAKINLDIVKALATSDLKERLLAMGAEAVSSTPDEFGAFLQKEAARWDKVLRQSGGM